MEPTQWRLAGSSELFQVGDGGVGPPTFSAPFDEQALRCVTPPRVGMAEMIDQLGAGSSPQVGLERGQSAFGSDAINPATILASTQVEFAPDFLRNVVRMFDDVALHIDQVESAVRAGFDANGPESTIAAGEEFAICFLRRATRDKRRTARGEHVAVDKVAHNIAYEDAAVEVG